MAICDVVATLANTIRQACRLTTPVQDLVIYEIQSMPLYRDINRLDIWDTVTRPLLALLDEDQSPIGKALRELIEFGALEAAKQLNWEAADFGMRFAPAMTDSCFFCKENCHGGCLHAGEVLRVG